MSHLLCLTLNLAAFAALALATERAQVEVLGQRLPAGRSTALRGAGWVLMLMGVAVAVSTWGWGLGLVEVSGYSSVAAGAVYLVLIAAQRRRA